MLDLIKEKLNVFRSSQKEEYIGSYLMTLIAIFTGLISWHFGLISLVLVGLAFPLACWLGKLTNINGKIGIINYSRGWENQELVYGLIQGIALWYGVLVNGVS